MMRPITATTLTLLLATASPLLAGKDSLIKAVESDNVPKVEKLIARGADVNMCSDYTSPLHEAVEFGGSLEITRMLLDAGADPGRICGGDPPLYQAANYRADPDVLQALIDTGVDVDVSNNLDQTPLQAATGFVQLDSRAVTILLRAGADIEAVDTFGNTPLITSAKEAQTADVVRALLEAGANPYVLNEKGERALDLIDSPHRIEDIGVNRPASLRSAIRQLLDSAGEHYEAKLAKKKLAEYQANLEEVWKRDADLPLTVRRDKYMVALTDHLKNERYPEALLHFRFLRRLDVELDPSFDFYHGEALILTDQGQQGVERLLAYVDANGPAATHYTRAMQLIAEVEADNDADTIWQRDDALRAETRKDKYMLALTQSLEGQHYDRALVYFELIERLALDRPAAFDFYQGEALLRTGDAEQAIKKLFDYIRAEGAEGQHYTRALELVNEAEQM